MLHVLFFSLLFLFSFGYAGFSPDTVILSSQKSLSIDQLQKNCCVFSYDPAKNIVVQGIVSNHKACIPSCACRVVCDYNISFIASPNQLVLTSGGWCLVKALKSGARLTCYDGSYTIVLSIEKSKQEQLLCEVTVEPNHTFCITPRGIIVHNNEFIAAGGSVFLGTLTATAMAAPPLVPVIAIIKGVAVVSILGVALWRSFKNKKKEKKNHNIIENSGGCSSPPPPKKPRNEDKYKNMYEVFEKAPIGKRLKDVVEDAHRCYKNTKMYRVIRDVKEWGIQKGDWLYLDMMHEDHIEVFTKNGRNLRTILNMDGTQNFMKIEQAGKRTIEPWIR